MTGFGKVTAELPSKKVTIEIKALNSKQLDLSTRVPSLYKEKEMEIRSLLLQTLERGKVDFSIYLEYIGKDSPSQINVAAIENYYRQIKSVAEKLDIAVPTDWFQTLLRMPDAIKTETEEPDESEWTVVWDAVNKAIRALQDFRIQEGAMLQKLFTQKVNNIAALLTEVEKYEGERIDRFPVTPKLEKCEPVYVTLPGWKSDIRGIRDFAQLPENARRYVEFLEEQIQCPIRMVSNGPRREEMMFR